MYLRMYIHTYIHKYTREEDWLYTYISTSMCALRIFCVDTRVSSCTCKRIILHMRPRKQGCTNIDTPARGTMNALFTFHTKCCGVFPRKTRRYLHIYTYAVNPRTVLVALSPRPHRYMLKNIHSILSAENVLACRRLLCLFLVSPLSFALAGDL